MLRARYLVDVQSISQVNGQPFKSQELEDRLLAVLKDTKGEAKQ